MQPGDCIGVNKGVNGVSSNVTQPSMEHENVDLLCCSNCHKWVLDFVQAVWACSNAAHNGALLVLDLTAIAFKADRIACPGDMTNGDDHQSHIRCVQSVFKCDRGG